MGSPFVLPPEIGDYRTKLHLFDLCFSTLYFLFFWLLGQKNRGDKTAIELFIFGVRGWEAGLRRQVEGISRSRNETYSLVSCISASNRVFGRQVILHKN